MSPNATASQVTSPSTSRILEKAAATRGEVAAARARAKRGSVNDFGWGVAVAVWLCWALGATHVDKLGK